MEEKIKIYLSNDVYQTILKDMELFEFYKKNHTLNRNEFLNKLVVNYYESYAQNNKESYEFIKKTLKSYGIDDSIVTNATNNILEYTTKKSLDLENKKLDIIISMKPTKVSSQAFDYINNFLLQGSSLSGWLRNLITSYAKLPQDKRERIIFKENFDIITQAISHNKSIYFLYHGKKQNNRHTVSPYTISSSKEELFNYLLAQETTQPNTFRVSRMYNVSILNTESNISNDSINIFEKMIKYGPQFSYTSLDGEPIKVLLTNKGIQMYNRFYLHRPPYTSIDENIYTFECSIYQAIQYFQRFGKDAIVISPTGLRSAFEAYYNLAHKAYRKINND